MSLHEPGIPTAAPPDVSSQTGPIDADPIEPGPIDAGPIDAGPIDAGPIGVPAVAVDPFDALDNRYRREILQMLHEGDLSVNEMAARLPVSRPAVSRHLKLLSGAGLVVETHSGTRHIFRLRPEGARAVQDYLEGVWGTGATPFRLGTENSGLDSAERT
jgi:DNA-binding transcriptional ArsR family regulator